MPDPLSFKRLETVRPIFPTCAAVPAPSSLHAPDLDDRTQAYAVAVRDGFERLEDAVRQLAAVLILAAAGRRRVDDHPARVQARRDLDEAHDRLRAVAPSPRAAHYQHHLLLAAAKTRLALHQPSDATEPALKILGEAAHHLRWAAGTLPGFEVVSLAEGCGCCVPMRRP